MTRNAILTGEYIWKIIIGAAIVSAFIQLRFGSRSGGCVQRRVVMVGVMMAIVAVQAGMPGNGHTYSKDGLNIRYSPKRARSGNCTAIRLCDSPRRHFAK